MRGGVLAAPLAALYGAALAARAALYQRGWLHSERAAVPVISVGNIVAGGTGKTPMVALTARILRDAGLRPVVVSRGYRGRRSQDPMVVSGRRGLVTGVTARQAGDEPVMLSGLLPGIPVVVARRRAEGAALAVTRFGAGCIVLDDGFQHLALQRDLDVVLLDAASPLDSGRLLPAGLLREGPAALARADAVLFSGPDPPSPGEAERVLELLRAGTPVFSLRCEPTLLVDGGGRARPVSDLEDSRVVAFAGIARPERFLRSLRKLGAQVESFRTFSDHHAYSIQEIQEILTEVSRRDPDLLITTEKDLARLKGSASGARIHGAAPVALRVEAFLREKEMAAFRNLLFSSAGAASPPTPPAGAPGEDLREEPTGERA